MLDREDTRQRITADPPSPLFLGTAGRPPVASRPDTPGLGGRAAEEHRGKTRVEAERVDDDDLECEEPAAEEASVGQEAPPVKKHLDVAFDELDEALDEKEWPLETDDLQILDRLVKLIEERLGRSKPNC